MISHELTIWLAALFFLLGITAMALEILFAGFGVAGVAGVIFFGWGFLLISGNIINTFQSLVIAIFITMLLFVLGLRLASKLQLWRNVTLSTRMDKSEGYVAPRVELEQYQDKMALTITPLRPAGTIDIDGERLDAVTEGGYIPPQTKVRVIEVSAGRIIVRAVE